MKLPTTSPILTTILLTLTAHAQAQAQAQAQLNTTSLDTLVHFECNERQFAQLTLSGSPRDCARAIMIGLPSSQELGLFHNGGGRDLFQLPRYSREGSCEVTVALNGPQEVQGNWAYVWSLAHMLITGCTYWRNNYPESYVSGGSISGGPGGMISVSMGYPGRSAEEGGVGNGTASVATS